MASRYYGVASSYKLLVPQIPSLIAVEKIVSHLVEATRYLSKVTFFMYVAPFSVSIAVDTVSLQSVYCTLVIVIAEQLLLSMEWLVDSLTCSS